MTHADIRRMRMGTSRDRAWRRVHDTFPCARTRAVPSMASGLVIPLHHRRPYVRFVCGTCGAVFMTAQALIDHVHEFRDEDDVA